MSEKDFRVLEDFFKRELERTISKEEALRHLQSAGILDKDGNHTPPYSLLVKFCKRIK